MTEKKEIRNHIIIALDDLKISFVEDLNKKYILKEEASLIEGTVSGFKDGTDTVKIVSVMGTLATSLDALAPKVPIISEKKLEKIKVTAKEKLAKKPIREELTKLEYDEIPEMANLENTVVLNAEILKQTLEKTKNEKNYELYNKIGKASVLIMMLILVVFAFSIPFII